MPTSTLWKREPHTAAKHEILKGYLDAWYPILGSSRGRVVFLDGFAGPGVYSEGEPGSPIVALASLIEHNHLPRLKNCEFVFVFNEMDPERCTSLNESVATFQASHALPENVKIQVSNQEFSEVARELAAYGRRLAPTFAFIDPFGYRDLEMKTLAELLAADKCELFCYFDYNSANRFATAGNVDDRFEALFGCDDFKRAPAAGDPSRGEFLVRLFEEQLTKIANFTHVQSFSMRTKSGIIGNYLVFATRSLKGLDKMKQVMWKVDPSGEYAFSVDAE
jgi:three-Cys-motif partner protein